MTGLLADVTPVLDERQRRLTAAAGARALGFGGIAAVVRETGMSRNTIKSGIRELEEGVELEAGRVRSPGAGRKRQTEIDPKLVEALDAWSTRTAVVIRSLLGAGRASPPASWATRSARPAIGQVTCWSASCCGESWGSGCRPTPR